MEIETKRDKFVRLAESRMANTLKQIDLLANLSNTNFYEYTLEDVDKIVKTLKRAIKDLEATFKNENKKFSIN